MQNLDDTIADVPTEAVNPLDSVPIEVTVSVGKARPLVRELLRLDRGTGLALDKKVDDPVEIYVGDQLIGVGTLEVVEGDEDRGLAVRISSVAGLSELK